MPGPESTPREHNVFSFPKVIVVPWTKIREDGVYDLDKLYETVVAWLTKNKYLFNENTQSKDLPQGKDIEIKWKGFRKVDDYVRFWMYVQMWSPRCMDVEVEENGKKVVRQTGGMDVRFYSEIEKDYENNFKRTKFGRFIVFILDRYFYKKKLLKYREKLRAETFEIQAEAKKVLKKLVV